MEKCGSEEVGVEKDGGRMGERDGETGEKERRGK